MKPPDGDGANSARGNHGSTAANLISTEGECCPVILSSIHVRGEAILTATCRGLQAFSWTTRRPLQPLIPFTLPSRLVSTRHSLISRHHLPQLRLSHVCSPHLTRNTKHVSSPGSACPLPPPLFSRHFRRYHDAIAVLDLPPEVSSQPVRSAAPCFFPPDHVSEPRYGPS